MRVIYRLPALFLMALLLLLSSYGIEAAINQKEADQRFNSLSKELRCLVCQNESLAESPAGLADDLRQEVRTQINTGKTDEEIKSYLVDRYGYFILYNPPFIGRTVFLWVAPFLLLFALGAWVIWQLLRKNKPIEDSRDRDDFYEKELAKIKKEFEQEQEK